MKALAPTLVLIVLLSSPARAAETTGKITYDHPYACDTFDMNDLMARLFVLGGAEKVHQFVMDEITRDEHISCRPFVTGQVVDVRLIDREWACVRAHEEKQRFPNEGLCYWLGRRSVDYGETDAFDAPAR